MMMRHFMNWVCYSNETATLGELPAILNRTREGFQENGFRAEGFGSAALAGLQVREFFRGNINPSTRVVVKGCEVAFSDVVPDGTGGLFDDFAQAWAATEKGPLVDVFYHSVKIAAKKDSTGKVVDFDVISYQKAPIEKESTDAIALQFTERRVSKGENEGGRFRHANVLGMLPSLCEGLHDPSQDPPLDDGERSRRHSEIYDVFAEVNGVRTEDVLFFDALTFYWGQRTVDEWKTAIRNVREKSLPEEESERTRAVMERKLPK
jgi:hypothetical protein